MASRVFGVAIPCAIGFAYLEREVLPTAVPALFAASPLLGGLVTKALAVPLLLTALACFWLTMHGFSVGSARAKFMELARKDVNDQAIRNGGARLAPLSLNFL